MTHWMHEQSMKNREQAHRMNDRGTPIDFIAKYLDADPDSVRRWLSMAKPVPLPKPDSDDSWMAAGVCNSTDPEIFYPERGASPARAIQVCQSCDVQERCLQWALAHNEQYGVWGGVMPDTRFRMRVNALERERTARKRGAA